MASIAGDSGFRDAETLYQDPANADLRSKRPNLNVLREGDRVVVPDRRNAARNIATGERHRFLLKRPKVQLVIKLMSERDTPLANVKCSLVVEGDGKPITSDGDGVVRTQIDLKLKTATLYVWADPDSAVPSDAFALELGALPPADGIDGAQARLANRGFFCGEADGVLGPRTYHALKAFQLAQGAAITGELDDETLKALEKAHGC